MRKNNRDPVSLMWANCIVEYNDKHYYSFINSKKFDSGPIMLYDLVTDDTLYVEERSKVKFIAPFHYKELEKQNQG